MYTILRMEIPLLQKGGILVYYIKLLKSRDIKIFLVKINLQNYKDINKLKQIF